MEGSKNEEVDVLTEVKLVDEFERVKDGVGSESESDKDKGLRVVLLAEAACGSH